jgi:hypothetical protein
MDFGLLRECLIENAPLELYERRREFRESESLDREMSLTEYIVKTDPLRSTTLIDWPHRPVGILDLEFKQQMARIAPEIRSTLRSPGLPDTLRKSTHVITQFVDPQDPDQIQITPRKILRIHLDDWLYLPAQLDVARDALRDMLQRLGHADVHVDIILGSNTTNIDMTDEETLDVQKVRLAIRLAGTKDTEILEGFLPGKQADPLPYMTRQYGVDVSAVVVAVEPLSRTNWLKLRQLILQELRKYTKMFLEVEFHPVYQEDQVKQDED